ncbi:MAG: caspase family protein [Gammaproteobacteria bacterium]|nr:caspase family protein [Gammaproteobacteria bacterium]
MNQQVFTQGHALIVGAGADLKCTADNAKGLATILKDEERCAYPAGQVQLLTEAKANRQGILTALDELQKTTGQDAAVVVYFSGHGYGQGASYYLIPHGCTQQNAGIHDFDRYRDLQNQVISGIIPLPQQNIANMEIAVAF